MKLTVMAVEQLGERVVVTGNMGGQQFGVAALPSHLQPKTHGRTVANRCGPSTSPTQAPSPLSRGSGYDAACTVISEMSARLLPAVEPSVEIHTSRFDVGDAALTGMLL